MDFTNEERRSLLFEIQSLATDAESDPEPLRSFLPLSKHQAALDPRTLVIQGERGSGKTAFFHFLSTLAEEKISILKIFPALSFPSECLWLTGFSEKGTEHPSPQVLDQLFRSATPDGLRYFWLGHLVGAFLRASWLPDSLASRPLGTFREAWSQGPNNPTFWLSAARENANELLTFLDDIETWLQVSSQTLFVLYDHLDRIGMYSGGIRTAFLGYLLQMWLSFSNRYNFLRTKIFVRSDLFQASLTGADASKLEARAVSLRYTEEELYRILWRHLLAFTSLRQLFEKARFAPLSFPLFPSLGFFPPKQLSSDDLLDFASLFSKRTIGTGTNKGWTYRWITSSLQDAKGNAWPRSFLHLFAFAANAALERLPEKRSDPLFLPDDLHASFQKTSLMRILEIQEEHPVIKRLESLRGSILFASKREVIQRLSSFPSSPSDLRDDGFQTDGEAAFEELVRLGVFKLRNADTVDLPEIYRHPFEMKRVLTTLFPQNEPRFA